MEHDITWSRWGVGNFYAPPPSVGGLDLDSGSSGCARLGLKKKSEVLFAALSESPESPPRQSGFLGFGYLCILLSLITPATTPFGSVVGFLIEGL